MCHYHTLVSTNTYINNGSTFHNKLFKVSGLEKVYYCSKVDNRNCKINIYKNVYIFIAYNSLFKTIINSLLK